MFGMSGRELLFSLLTRRSFSHPFSSRRYVHSFVGGQVDSFGNFCRDRVNLENFPPLGEEVTSETSTT